MKNEKYYTPLKYENQLEFYYAIAVHHYFY
jgi:hypothetical protein